MRHRRTAVAAMTGVALLAGAGTAPASPGGGADQGRVVCGIVLPDGTSVVLDRTAQVVVTPSGTGKLTCHARTDVAPDRAVRYDTECRIDGIGQTTGRTVVTPSGRAQLTCRRP